MVDLINANVGRVVEYLRETGELDNAFIVIISDNGAEGQLLEAVPILAGHTLKNVITKWYDNSLENLGNHNSFVWYGTQWAGAATAPSRGVKTFTTEGGIHCPCIVRYSPSLTEAGCNRAKLYHRHERTPHLPRARWHPAPNANVPWEAGSARPR